MYFETEDFLTVWKLAHHWTGEDENTTDEKNLPPAVKQSIYRILHAIAWNELATRTKSRALFTENGTFEFLIELSHHLKIRKCIRKGIFDKQYLSSLYVKRPNVLSWCEKDYLTPPPIWKIENSANPETPVIDQSLEDENSGWYDDLSELRKQRVACLELAKKLWSINPNQSYEEIYNHPSMIQYGKHYLPDNF